MGVTLTPIFDYFAFSFSFFLLKQEIAEKYREKNDETKSHLNFKKIIKHPPDQYLQTERLFSLKADNTSAKIQPKVKFVKFVLHVDRNLVDRKHIRPYFSQNNKAALKHTCVFALAESVRWGASHQGLSAVFVSTAAHTLTQQCLMLYFSLLQVLMIVLPEEYKIMVKVNISVSGKSSSEENPKTLKFKNWVAK